MANPAGPFGQFAPGQEKDMKYHWLLFDWHGRKNIMTCLSKELYGIDEKGPNRGLTLDRWDDRVTFTYRPRGNRSLADHLGNDLGWFIVSPKFRGVLEDCVSEGIQYLPITLQNESTGEMVEGYQVANIFLLVDAVDREHSVVNEYSHGGILHWSVVKFALRRDKVEDLDVFRVKESDRMVSISVFLSERVKNAIEKNGITGVDFLEVGVY